MSRISRACFLKLAGAALPAWRLASPEAAHAQDASTARRTRIDNLIQAYDVFLRGDKPSGVYNMGGGRTQTLSLLELLAGGQSA